MRIFHQVVFHSTMYYILLCSITGDIALLTEERFLQQVGGSRREAGVFTDSLQKPPTLRALEVGNSFSLLLPSASHGSVSTKGF